MVEMTRLRLFRFIRGYDPAMAAYKARPSQTNDVVTCLDVLDQLEDDFVEAAIKDVAQFTDRLALLNVITYCCYEQLMAHWRPVLPPGVMLDVDYEALVTDRETDTRCMIAFAGLEWDDACLRPQDNRHKVNTASMWQARQGLRRSRRMATGDRALRPG